MSEDNRAQFNNLTRKILDLLILACPAPVRLDAKALGLPEGAFVEGEANAFSGVNRSYKTTPEEVFLKHCLIWLEHEGLIKASGERERFVATMKSLALYGQLPSALQS